MKNSSPHVGSCLRRWRCRHVHQLLLQATVLGGLLISGNMAQGATAISNLVLPHAPIFDDPWVQSNIAVACAHRVQDGIGFQTLRLLSVYALAETLHIRHLFRPIECVGHIGTKMDYKQHGCSGLSSTDQKRLRRAQQTVQLPSTVTEAEASRWQQVVLPRSSATDLVKTSFVRAVVKAWQSKKATLFKIVSLTDLVKTYPDMFLNIPQLRPSHPLPPLSNQQHNPSALGLSEPVHRKPWLKVALRIGIHIRRGDLKRESVLLPTEYYINMANTIAKVLDEAGYDYACEVYVEAPLKPEHVAEIQLLRGTIPNVMMLVDMDMLWSWQMMASADFLITSNSMFSLTAALLNPNAIVINVPEESSKQRVGQFQMKHWIRGVNAHGDLSDTALQQIKARLKPVTA